MTKQAVRDRFGEGFVDCVDHGCRTLIGDMRGDGGDFLVQQVVELRGVDVGG